MKGKRLLLVDDDPKNIKILRESFSLAEFDVDFAPSDTEAFTKIELNPPDVIVTELAPPKIDGYRLLEQVERNPKTADVPVIFLTKKSDVWNRVKSFKLGAKDYIVKPLHVKEIVARINMVLNRIEKRKMQEAEEKRKHTGRLEDLSVIDLIESLGVKRKSGVLTLTNENGKSGQIFFSEGSIINASCGSMVSEDAVYQMVAWRKGRFTIVFKQVDVPDEISVSNLGLLMQAAKRMEQREKILALLPASNCVFALSDTFKKIISKKGVNPELEKFVNLFDGVNDISRIIDASDFDDLRTLERINKLYKLGFLEIRENGTTVEPKTDQPMPPVRVLEPDDLSQPLPITKIAFDPGPVSVPEEPLALSTDFSGPANGDNGDMKEEVEPILPAESLPTSDLATELVPTELEATDDIRTEPARPNWTEPDAFGNLDLLNEKVTEESLLNQDLFYTDSWIQASPARPSEPIEEAEMPEKTFAVLEPLAPEAEQFPLPTPEPALSDSHLPDDLSSAAPDLEQPLQPSESVVPEEPSNIHQRLDDLEKNYPFAVFASTPEPEPEPMPEPKIAALIPELPVPAEPEFRPEPAEKPRVVVPANNDDPAKKFGLGSRSDREASLNQLIREVIPEKKVPTPMPEPPVVRSTQAYEEPVQQPLPAPIPTEPVPRPAEIPVAPLPKPPATKPIPAPTPARPAVSTGTPADQGTIAAPSASKAQKEQPNIMIVTNDSQLRTEVIDVLTGGEYLAHSLGGTSLTDVFMGSVQFKGGRSIKVLGITVEKEFKPVVDYLSARILGYIFLINASRVSNWNYLGYLANTLNNKLNLPALILVYWDSGQGSWNEATIRARLSLLEGQKMFMISEINAKTARRAIFSLFGVTQSVEIQES